MRMIANSISIVTVFLCMNVLLWSSNAPAIYLAICDIKQLGVYKIIKIDLFLC